ncbi:MAG: glycoside hydrolase family 28 protein [bacterium]
MKKLFDLIKNYILFISLVFICLGSKNEKADCNWLKINEIIKRIEAPVFLDKVYNITMFGAVGNGTYDCTEAFKKAIEECSKNGGGKVLVPEGTFLTGAIYLKSNVNLFVSENAIVKFSSEKSKYLPLVLSRWEGIECMNYSALIYSNSEENIAVTGSGILDGQGSNTNWWSWKGNKEDGWEEGGPNQKMGRNTIFDMAENNIPAEERIMGDRYYLRPNFIQFYNSKNILIQGVKLINSPMWFINPVLCSNVSVIGVKIEGLGPNNDGCDPESCKDVLIKDCFFKTGDDCIAIKSGRNNDGRRINVPCENIIIQNCTMEDGHGGVVIGSEISGGVKNVFAENCTMSSPNLDRAIRIKTNSIRGGLIENIFIRNLTVGEVSEAVLKIDCFYEEGDAGKFTPIINNIVLDNITSLKSNYALWIRAYERSKVTGLVIKNSQFSAVKNEDVLENVDNPIFENTLINGKLIK